MVFAKKTLIMVVVGVVVIGVGIGGGVYVGMKYFAPEPVVITEPEIPDPGPMVELGQFTATLADKDMHIVKLKVTVELSGPKASERLAAAGWTLKMKDEVMKTLKDQRYDSIRFVEGMEKLKQDLKTRLNAILPRVEGQASVNKVLFDEYMVQ